MVGEIKRGLVMDVSEIIADMYRKHKAESHHPCPTVRDYMAEFKEEIYVEITNRTSIGPAASSMRRKVVRPPER